MYLVGNGGDVVSEIPCRGEAVNGGNCDSIRTLNTHTSSILTLSSKNCDADSDKRGKVEHVHSLRGGMGDGGRETGIYRFRLLMAGKRCHPVMLVAQVSNL